MRLPIDQRQPTTESDKVEFIPIMVYCASHTKEASRLASVRFTDVQSRPTAFLDFTSFIPEEFQQLVPPFEAAFHAHMREWHLDGQPRTARRFTVYKTCPLPTPED